ncbi:biotin--[acetyl-CoA-carboxylase] ligase [Chryseosolibacter indicus]|uniref:Biotin--[acetyl-CoA-carboxylase] ligase n=1 Tax=Chryseosolibacter indicus TaxID=2782351 RepID=A0ABS5VRQ7_9BACT|nr:biotin--[acetyl-CoA-carboxylase] ligase [Chryseosolibacter indicus]MBT1704130.1 biotin--[acetyl-CoA-carboxylase] ligase [Chryseosolibacter indicus]
MYKIPANTLFLAKNIVFVPECHSTNTLALELSQQPHTSDGTVVITEHQTLGRGQRGNTWEAEPGKNLTFSVILKPAFLPVKNQFFLNIFASLAIYDLLRNKTDGQINIKWPNDIYINGKKLCGILIENQIRGSQVSNTILGIGLNVNQRTFSRTTATSLSLVTDKNYDLPELLQELSGCLEARYLQLRAADYKQLKEEYLNKLYWIKEKHTFAARENEFIGQIIGVDENGRLLVETPKGVEFFDVKEISYVN